jgi:pimeloyl-ACP methyl ester carboxylesterase
MVEERRVWPCLQLCLHLPQHIIGSGGASPNSLYKQKDTMNKTDRISQQITLADGRKLGYAEYGDPSGKPIFYFHGAPGSRVDWLLFGDEAWAQQHRARFIAVDRPGIGLSDFQPDRRFSDWPNDVRQLADALGIDRFAVLGVSGGGPYVAVCAAKLADRLTAAAIVSGVGPFSETPEVYELIRPGSRTYWTLARKSPFRSRLFLRFMKFMASRSAERVGEAFGQSMPDADKACIPQIQQIMVDALLEALRPGPRGAQYEAWLYQQPWDFRLEGITMDVHLWHGEADTMIPVIMGRYVAEKIPNCHSTFYEGEGHISLSRKYRDEIVSVLVA